MTNINTNCVSFGNVSFFNFQPQSLVDILIEFLAPDSLIKFLMLNAEEAQQPTQRAANLLLVDYQG